MKKKSVLLFCVCIAVLLLAACGNKAVTSAPAAAFNATGFPIVNEPLTLRVIAAKHVSTKDYPELPVFQEMEKLTGIKINWEYAGADWGTNKPLLLASGDLPDFFLGRGVLGEGDVVMNKEMFLDLTPLVEKYGDNLKTMFAENPGIENFAKATDGKIYGLPQKMPKRPENYEVWSINQNWLDKLNLRAPTTTEEFYQVLKAFKTRDPNGNGIADEIPWSPMGFGDNSGIMNIFAPFGVVSSMGNSWLSVINGKVYYHPDQEGFVDAVIYLHRLYAEGLLDQETFSNTDGGIWFAKLNPPAGAPETVGVSGFWSRDIIWGQERQDHYSVLLPLKGPTGYQAWVRNSELVQSAKYVAEIPSSSKNPEIIIRWLDALYEPLMGLRLYYGSPAVQANGDGTYDAVLPPADSGIDNDTWIWGNSMGDTSPVYYGNAADKLLRNDYLFGQQYNDKLLLAPYFKDYFPTMAATTPEENDELSLLRTDIHPFAQEQTALWIVNGGIEQEYDGFIRQLKGMGLDRMVEIYQGIYDRYVGK
jgi:putative aldouronate transport system substrate-binding protein